MYIPLHRCVVLFIYLFIPECFAGSNGFILIEANGGLNQQRSTVCTTPTGLV